MNTLTADHAVAKWLQKYYIIRVLVSILWILLAISIGKHSVIAGAILLVAYPAWDALANLIDANKSGGLAKNSAQRINFIVSLAVALAIGVALIYGTSAAIIVFGLWAIASGLFQLLAALKRRAVSGGQWAMILSGAQSALAGGFFIKQAVDGIGLDVSVVTPYAAFGAFYFAVAAALLALKNSRQSGVKGHI